jgi:hypothetical protein
MEVVGQVLEAEASQQLGGWFQERRRLGRPMAGA